MLPSLEISYSLSSLYVLMDVDSNQFMLVVFRCHLPIVKFEQSGIAGITLEHEIEVMTSGAVLYCGFLFLPRTCRVVHWQRGDCRSRKIVNVHFYVRSFAAACHSRSHHGGTSGTKVYTSHLDVIPVADAVHVHSRFSSLLVSIPFSNAMVSASTR